MSSAKTALEKLRSKLLALEPTGHHGFEGLLAESLAALSGLTIRLAKSGSQFGRDGSSPTAPFAIAMEAKRYTDELRLEILAGKAIVAGLVLQDKVDLWVLGATAEVSDDALPKLTDILEGHGVTLLTLDWAPHPLPPIAVLLTATRATTLAWFKQYRPAVAQTSFAAWLDEIAADPSYDAQLKLLRESVCAEKVGLDALRRASAEWLRQRLRDQFMSQQAFGQKVIVANADSPDQARPLLVKQLAESIVPNATDISIVAVLGGEGIGKTWLVAQWWAGLPEPPILLLVAGRRADHLVAGDATGSLAHLLAEQAGYTEEQAVRGWRRRLRRWKGQGAAEHVRFIVVLDGINEQQTRPWADLIKGLAAEVQSLGGTVIVTCRTAFWQRDIVPRLRGTVAIKTIEVNGYTDEELAGALAPARIGPADLSPKVREFVRNPRVCAVALHLLNRLTLTPNELTVDRLLLEYWQLRMQERGDLVAHNVLDFEKLLRSHAQAWLNNPERTFDRDEWLQHSGAARRFGQQHVQNDLTEIEEGRFLKIAEDNSGAYEFRSEVVPYALGLLVNSELKDELKKGNISTDEHLSRILDAIRGFDRVAEIIAAATGLACLDKTFPPRGRSTLIGAWLGLQNIDDDAFSAMAAYVPACPESFLNAVEWPASRGSVLSHHETLLALIMETRDRPSVRDALADRIPKWLGRWSRQAQAISQNEASQIKRQKDREARIDSRLSSMSASEHSRFRQLTFEETDAPALLLDHTAALFIAGRPLAPFAGAIWGWALAQAVAGDAHRGDESLGWVVRLNPIDWTATTNAVHQLLMGVDAASSEPTIMSAATILRILGDKVSSDRADSLVPASQPRQWRRIESFCDTNPHDPDAPQGTNLDNARNAATSLVPADLWIGMGPTPEDYELESLTPALARFDPKVVVKLLRELASTAPARTGIKLRQLSWRLVGISPILDAAAVKAVRHAYHALIADPGRLGSSDFHWVASAFVRAIAPHLRSEEQLRLILSLPDGCPLFLNLRAGLEPLPAEVLETNLDNAQAAGRTQDLARILFFASASKPELTPRSRLIIAEGLNSSEPMIALPAADIVYIAEDADLYDAVLGRLADNTLADAEYDILLYRGRAIAEAVATRRRSDLLSQVPSRFLGRVAAELGDVALDLLAIYIGRVLDRLVKPVAAAPPHDIRLTVQTIDTGLDAQRSVDDISGGDSPRDLRAFVSQVNNPEAAAEEFSKRQTRMIAESLAYERAISDEDAREIVMALPGAGLRELVARNPAQLAGWIAKIIEQHDPQVLARIRNFGLSLAGAFTLVNPDMAAKVFLHLRDTEIILNVIIGHERIPLYEHVLFSTPDAESLTAIRRSVFARAYDDATIEMATLAAELGGAGLWLTQFVDELATSTHPSIQARALTIAGFRQVNPDSDRALAVDRGGGFLGTVTAAARKCYRRAEWARRWVEAANSAEDPVDFWRFSTLAEGVCDIRIIPIFQNLDASVLLKRYGCDLFERLKKAAQERSKKRAATLFGVKPPERDLLTIVRDGVLPI